MEENQQFNTTEPITELTEAPTEAPLFEAEPVPTAEPTAPEVPTFSYHPEDYAPVTAPVTKTPHTGMKVFLGIAAVTLAVCILLTAGFLAGKELNLSGTNKAPAGVTTKPVGEKTLTDAEVYEAVHKSIVGILVYNADGSYSTATGVVFNDQGYVISNDHIYSGAVGAKFILVSWDGKEHEAHYVAGDTRSDLSVLKTEDTDLVPATFGDSNTVVVGESALAIGCTAGAYEDPILTVGIISSASRRVTSSTTSYSTKFIQTDSAINPGSSGGALVNAYGQVVGITSSKIAATGYDGTGFAIPSNVAVANANLLIEKGYVAGRAKLGITYTENDLVITKLNPNKVRGLEIQSIAKESPLSGIGVAVGDVIVGINDTPVTQGDTVLDVIESKKAGDSIVLSIYSANKKTTGVYTVTLIEDEGGSSYQTATPQNGETANG